MDSSVSVLQDSLVNDPAPEVQETCELALRRIKEQQENSNANENAKASPFLSVDPALPASIDSSVEKLRYYCIS